jgi:hypothetical protein
MEAAGSLRFNNPPSDSNTTLHQQVGSSTSMPGLPEERNEENDPTLNTLQQLGIGRSSSIQETRRSEDAY